MPITSDQIEVLRMELEAALTRLERSLVLGEDASRPVELDQQAVGRLSRMDAIQSQRMSQGLQARQEARADAIRIALRRIESGTYGRCLECKGEIDPGRLFVMPETAECGSCAGT